MNKIYYNYTTNKHFCIKSLILDQGNIKSCLNEKSDYCYRLKRTFGEDVSMSEYAFATTGQLRTTWVSSCIALSLFAKDTHETFLAHIAFGDPNTSTYLKEIRQMFKGNDFEIKISSPQADNKFRESVRNAVLEYFGQSIDLGTSMPLDAISVQIESSTGKVEITGHNFVYPYSSGVYSF